MSTNTTKNKETTTKTTKTPAPKVDNKDKEIASLQKQLQEVMALVQNLQGTQNSIPQVETQIISTDINPNAKTKITSLCHGTLTLYHPYRGFLKFKEYGETHSVTYAVLSDYVTNARESAEKGVFYIHNQRMVEDLGLSEFYEKIMSKDISNRILTTDNLDLIEVLRNTTESQKSSFAELVAQKAYEGEITDLNKIDAISKATNIDIMQKLQEMKKFDETQREISSID